MSKVLSTKLTVDEVDRFNAAAKQQGLSKSGLLKRLVKEYFGDRNEGSKTPTNCKVGNRSSLEKRQAPVVCKLERLPLDKQEVSQNKKPQKYFNNLRPTNRVHDCTWYVDADSKHVRISNTAIDLQTIADLAKVPDSRETLTRK